MCGIAGIIFEEAIPEAAIVQMVAALQHRGPDAQSHVTLPGCHLGHTRLSIIDLAGGAQPMRDPTGRYWIVFNGEIYNFRELRDVLKAEGREFLTQSDTEVLLQAFLAYGEQVVDHLNGQFAFAIWDSHAHRLFGARDRFGEKPLYWATGQGGSLLIASEIKAFCASGLLAPRLDRLSAAAYLGLLYVPPHRTIYENVAVLPPAHAFRWEAGQWHQWAYWSPRFAETVPRDPREVIEHVGMLIHQAVERQMVADVPIGAFLSGGLDSSTIVALMSGKSSSSVKTFAVGFGELINELPYARVVAETYRTEHHEIEMTIPVGDMLEHMAVVYDEPFADSSNIPTYLVAAFARQHVKVVLSGDGGDELFGGYEWYLPLLEQKNGATWATLPPAAAAAFLYRVLARLGCAMASKRNAAVMRYSHLLRAAQYPDLWERHCAQLWQAEAARFGDLPDNVSVLQDIRHTYQPSSACFGLDRAVDFDLRCYLPGDILVKVDRAAMAHGLETRAPFLDRDLVDFVTSIPSRIRFEQGISKQMLRASCGHLWPALVQQRGKQGFGAPLQAWVARPDVQALATRIFRADSPLVALLPGVERCWPRFSPQDSWSLLCLGLWLELRPECLR